MIDAYETKIKTIEDEKLVIHEKMTNSSDPVRGYDDTYRTAMEFLANPFKFWASGRLDHKRAVLKMTFADKLTYVRSEGYRTAKTTFPFNVLSGLFRSNDKMVARGGFEPPTRGFSARN